MSKNSNNVNVFNDGNYAVWTAQQGTTPPTTLPPANPGANYYECGLLSANGLTEAHNMNETSIYDLAGSLVRIARSQESRPWTFEALEGSNIVDSLRYPGSTVTTSGGTAEVQSLAVTATGGTFTLSGGSGGTGVTSAITAPATSSALQTAIRTLPGFSAVTVSGSGPFTITFPIGLGNVGQLTADATNATGGTVTPSTTTPGVASVNSRGVGSGTGRNLRQWAIDLVDGSVHKRVLINNGEAVWTGTTTYSGSAAATYQFTLQPYKDSNGLYYVVLDDDPATSAAFV